MSQRERRTTKLVLTLFAGGLLLAVLLFRGTPIVKAHVVPSPCDFTTGGGFVITDNGNHANFGLVGGCKPNRFFGHVNFVDHDTSGAFAGLHLSSDSIDGYFDPRPNGQSSTFRDICGTADTNLFGPVKFRARTQDNGEPGVGVDKFGLKIRVLTGQFAGDSAVVIMTRLLAGGNIQLHKPAPPNTTGPATPDEVTACGDFDSGLGF